MFNSSQLAIINHLLVYEPTSRKRLAKILTLTTAAVTINVNQLIEKGIVYELKSLDLGKVGRKETLLDVVDDAFYAIGLDVEEDRVSYSLTSLKGRVIDTRKFSDVDEAIILIEDLSKRKKNILGVTVMLRGYINEGSYFHPDKMIKSKLEALSLPYLMINNVSALAIMHRFYNYDDENFLLIKYGPGVGSAIMVNGGLVSQRANANSEIGQMILDINQYNRLENCIRYDKLHSETTDDTIIAYLKRNPDQLNYLIKCLAVSIVNSHVLLSLEKIIVAGIVFTDDEIFDALTCNVIKLSRTLAQSDIVRIENYSEKRRKIGSIVTIYGFFNGLL